MANESRLHKSFLNARVNLIFYLLTLVLSFFSRKIFLDSLGADFVGLTGTIQNLLGFLNLAEMGIGAAIGFVLYRPLFEHDKEKINEIISVLAYMYRSVGIIILIVGFVLSLFLPLIFAETEFDCAILYFVYYSFLTSSLIGYFINYRHTLLAADQRNYVVIAYYQTINIVKVLIQIVLAYRTGNYYLWALIELIFGIIYSFILNIKINQVYPWLESNVKLGKQLLNKYPEIIKYAKQLFVHKIAAVVYGQISPFLIYAFSSLQVVAYYGNYNLIVSKLDGVAFNLLNSTSAGVGSLIAEGNKTIILKTYWELMSLRFWIAGVFIFTLYYLLPPFIYLWLGEQYVMPNSVLVLLLITYFLGFIRGTNDQFISGYGLFSDIWAPFAEAIVSIVIAVIGGKLWGIEGVLLGRILSMLLIVNIWKPYFLYKRGFELPIWDYWISWIKDLLLMLLSFYLSHCVISIVPYELCYNRNWSSWFICAIVTVCIQGPISFILFYMGTDGMKTLISRLLNRLRLHK